MLALPFLFSKIPRTHARTRQPVVRIQFTPFFTPDILHNTAAFGGETRASERERSPESREGKRTAFTHTHAHAFAHTHAYAHSQSFASPAMAGERASVCEAPASTPFVIAARARSDCRCPGSGRPLSSAAPTFCVRACGAGGRVCVRFMNCVRALFYAQRSRQPN